MFSNLSSKVAHNRPQTFFSSTGPTAQTSPELIFHIIKCREQASVLLSVIKLHPTSCQYPLIYYLNASEVPMTRPVDLVTAFSLFNILPDSACANSLCDSSVKLCEIRRDCLIFFTFILIIMKHVEMITRGIIIPKKA